MKNLLLGIVATGALLAFLLFWEQIPGLIANRDRPGAPELPTADSYMNDTLTRKFDENGRLAYRLTTAESAYFDPRKAAVLTTPRLLAMSDPSTGEPWHLKADTGVLHNAERRVELRDQVVVWRNGPQGKNELRTSKLVYYPDSGRLQTDQPLTLRSPTSNTEAIGLEADLNQQVYRLLSKVRSVHRPQ